MENEAKMRIQKNTIITFIVLGILNCPGTVTRFITIISKEQKFLNTYYGTLSYSVNLLEMVLVMWGFFLCWKSRNSINILPILGWVLFKDFIIFIQGNCSPFSLNSWEMYIWPLIGAASCFVVCEHARSEEGVNRFLDGIILVNFFVQVLLIISGRSGITGAEAIAQGHNSVGYLAAIHIMYSLLLRDKNKKLIMIVMISFVSILFSGSRFSLLISLIGVCVFLTRIMKSVRKRNRHIARIVLSIGIVVVIFFIANPSVNSKYEILSRVSSIFKSTNVVNNIRMDQSFQERIESFNAGIRMIKDNPFGVSNSYIDVYLKIREYDFYSFPHSTLLTFYLLWGPIFLICIIWILIRMKKTDDRNMFDFLIFILCCFMFYGGLEVAPKWYAYIFALFSIIRMREKAQIEKNNLGN